ncbi:hypothetical protein ACRAWD_20295 [Caulobacter segnis]
MRVKIETIEWAQWLDQVSWPPRLRPDHRQPRRRRWTTPSTTRPTIISAITADAFHGLMEALKGATDEGQRTAILGQIQRRIAEDAVNGFLFQFRVWAVFDARLKGLLGQFLDPTMPTCIQPRLTAAVGWRRSPSQGPDRWA